MAYCQLDDVIERISQVGLVYVADDDGSDDVSNAEQSAVLSRAIASATAEIDAALAPHGAVGASNDWLRFRAVDLAAERVVSRKGQAVPASLADAARRSRDWLEQVRRGELRVPGLTDRSGTSVNVSSLGRPRLINPQPPVDEE